MKTWLALTTAVALAGTTAGCCGLGYPLRRADAGTVLGGVAGGVVGSHLGRGHGRTAGIIAGTLVGAAVGHEVGRSIDATEDLEARRAPEAHVPDSATPWVDPDGGARVARAPAPPPPTGQEDRPFCREYTTTVTVGGAPHRVYGTACRRPDGSWQVVESAP